MHFLVEIEGDAQQPFGTVDLAIDYARTRLYLSPAKEVLIRNDLRKGQIAVWSYGFKSGQIIPRQDND